MRVLVASIINQIRQNLRDRYKSGFPIIKELIQNADDAFAKHIDLVQIDKIPEAQHPLLNGPALIVINDGEFDEKNARAINCIGLSSKTGNPHAVGRYGLGLKSIFHLCEAFFFISHIDKQLHIVNPWAETIGLDQEVDSAYPEWDNCSLVDSQAVLKNLEVILRDYSSFLCLVIPLRKKSHFDRRHAIIQELPGEEGHDLEKILQPSGNQSSGLENELCRLFPQLRALEEIRSWHLEGNGKLESIFNLRLAKESSRLAFPLTKIPSNEIRPFHGGLKVQLSGARISEAIYAGVEACFDKPIFSQMKASTLWPRHSNEDPETHELIEQSDNAQPHVAVIFNRFSSDSESGHLSIRRAVFLPLEKQAERVDIKGNGKYGLTLHGWFFVDAGRSEVPGWEHNYQPVFETGEELTLGWNGALAQQGTLQLIIPALENFVTKSRLSLADTSQLTSALEKSKLFAEYRQYICKNNHWVYCYQGSESGWRRLPANQRILHLPEPPASDLDRPLKVFPEILNFGPVTIIGKPKLSNITEQLKWEESILANLLSTVPVRDVFSSQGLLGYLVDVLKIALPDSGSISAQHISNLSAVFLKMIRETFATIDLRKLDENRSLIAQIIKLIPVDKKFVIQGKDEDLRKPEYLELLSVLFQLKLELIIIPSNFDISTDAENTSLSVTHAEAILKALGTVSTSIELPGIEGSKEKVAIQVFNSVTDRQLLIMRCGDLSLFKGKYLSRGISKEQSLSLSRLKSLSNKNLLFQYASDGTDTILGVLSLALQDISPVVIRREINKSLDLNAAESNLDGCLSLLESAPRLADIAQREGLIRSLLQSLDNVASFPKRKAILRYLLHGFTPKYNDQSNLFVLKDTTNVWARLALAFLRYKEEEWRILDPRMALLLTPIAQQKLNISELDEKAVLTLVRSLAPRQISSLELVDLSPEDRNELLTKFSLADAKDLLKNLRIHETVNGSLVSLAPNTFLESNVLVPSSLSRFATLLRSPNNDYLQMVYKELGVFPLGAGSIIQLAISSEYPVQHWRIIMDALHSMGKQPDQSVLAMLKAHSWIPTKAGGQVEPSEILNISGMEPQISSLLEEFDYPFLCFSELNPELLSHPAQKTLVEFVLPDQHEMVKRLGTLVANLEKYCIGNLEKDRIDAKYLRTFIEIFWDGDGSTILPAVQILQVIEATQKPSDVIEFANLLCGSISTSRLVDIFNHVAKVHETAAQERKGNILEVFNSYLALAADLPNFYNDILPAIRLLNKNKKWKRTDQLTYKAKGIDPNDLLDDVQGRYLKLSSDKGTTGSFTISATALGNYEHDLRTGADLVKNYFSEWEPYIQNLEIIGGFLCLLGDQPGLHNLAEKYLGRRDVDQTRELLDWMTDAAMWHKGETVRERMKRQFFFIKVVDSETKTVMVKALTDATFNARLLPEETLHHLLYEGEDKRPVTPPIVSGQVYDFLCLRKLRLDQTDPGRLIELLKETARILLFEAYYQDIPNFDDYWRELEQTDQLDIEIAQDTIIDSAFTYIPTLGLATHNLFRQKIKTWEDIRSRDVQAKHNARRKGKESTTSFEKEREKLRNELKSDLESTESQGQVIRAELLKAVRRKIGEEYQYRRSSILFELFQNADDAVAELGVLFDEAADKVLPEIPKGSVASDRLALRDYHRRVVVDWDAECIRFAHWGRSINQIRPGSGEVYGYDADLIKMLMMQRSDKLIAPELNIKQLTGKFGLGFKSVFLISQKPAVLSGRLKFEIVAGLYPTRIKQDDLTNLTNHLAGWSIENNRDGTLFELPIDLDVSPSVLSDTVVKDFYKWADLLVIFAHEINRIELMQKGSAHRSIEWHPERLAEGLDWFLGKLRTFGSGSKPSKISALVWKTAQKNASIVDENGGKNHHGSLLFTFSNSGCIPIDADVPRIWVTAPTESALPVGFVINANFALDVGRAQLARSSEQNQVLARDIGRKFGESLVDLFNYTNREWKVFCRRVGLVQDITPYDFWESIWKIACEPLRRTDPSEGANILKRFLGSSGSGLEHLYTEEQALPTDLPNEYQTLTKLGNVRFWVEGVLEKPDVFNQVSAWAGFSIKAPKGTIVSKTVRESLVHLLSETPKWESISLWKTVTWVIGPANRVLPEQASLLGQLITSGFINELDRFEQESLGQFLRKLEFKTIDGSYRPAPELLTLVADIKKEHELDEFLRAQFAPTSLVLSREYSEKATQFFRACREKLYAPVEKLVDWAITADNDTRQRAVLEYLLHGELHRDLAESMRNSSRLVDFERSWLASLYLGHELLQGYDQYDQSILMGLLRLQQAIIEPPPPPLPSANVILETIYDWWERNHAGLISQYEQDIYPMGASNPLCSDLEYLEDPSNRREWMMLFLLGSYHTIGRTRSSAYRNFLSDCQQRGWFDTFTLPTAEADKWIDVLDGYLEHVSDDSDAQYQYLFMRQFVNIYKISRFLIGYAEVFISINQIRARFQLDQITNPNESEIFSGSGLPIIPQVSNTLGLGACFVLRELVRKNVVTSPFAREHCYAPVRRLREFFMEMGCNLSETANISMSTQIYHFLVSNLGEEKASFLNSFDIPFLMIIDQYGGFREFWSQNRV